MILVTSADLDIVGRATLSSAVGTARQRCTTLRRLTVHESMSIKEEMLERLEKAYAGDPLMCNHVGILVEDQPYDQMQVTLGQAW